MSFPSAMRALKSSQDYSNNIISGGNRWFFRTWKREEKMNVLEGIIHGNIIELQNSLGFQDGQKVFVSVTVAPSRAGPVGG